MSIPDSLSPGRRTPGRWCCRHRKQLLCNVQCGVEQVMGRRLCAGAGGHPGAQAGICNRQRRGIWQVYAAREGLCAAIISVGLNVDLKRVGHNQGRHCCLASNGATEGVLGTAAQTPGRPHPPRSLRLCPSHKVAGPVRNGSWPPAGAQLAAAARRCCHRRLPSPLADPQGRRLPPAPGCFGSSSSCQSTASGTMGTGW